MPTTLKRPSLGRLLASLRPPPSRKGSPSNFPVQIGFPTSLADLVVKNHGRLRKPRKPRRPTAALVPPPSPPPVAPTVAAEDLPLSPPPQPLSPVAVQQLDAARRRPEGGAVFRLRPDLLVLGGTVALALLAVWSEGTVAAFTVAALSLLWIESASRRRRRRRLPAAEADATLDSCGRGAASPIREVEESPRPSCSDSDKGSEAAERSALVAGSGDDSSSSKRKGKRSLRKLISKKLQKKPKSKDSPISYNGEAKKSDDAAGDTQPVTPEAPSPSGEQTPSESSTEWSSSSSSSEATVIVVDRRGASRFPLAAFVPVILTGLAVGKLPATAISVLCIVFSSAVQRLK